MRTVLESLVAVAAVLVTAILCGIAAPSLGNLSFLVSIAAGMLVGGVGASIVTHRHYDRKWGNL